MRNKCLLCFLMSALTAFSQQPSSQAPISNYNVKAVQGVGPGYWATAGSGMTLNISKGSIVCNGTTPVTYAGGTLTMTASQTNYVYLDSSASCVPASNITGFSASNSPIAIITAGSSSISVSDWRPMGVRALGISAGGLGNGTTVIDATLMSGADMGMQIMAALAQAYAQGGGTVDGRGFVCPTNCQIGTQNLTIGDGLHPVTVYLPKGTVTRGELTSTLVSAQILLNSNIVVYAEGTTISGPSDATAVQQAFGSAGNVTNIQWYGGAIADTGSVVQGSATLMVGGPNTGGVPFIVPAGATSYVHNAIGASGTAAAGAFFAGGLAHMAIYQSVLTPTQIAAHYADRTNETTYNAKVVTDGATNHWILNDTGSTAVDVIGGKNGTYEGTVGTGSGGGVLWADSATYVGNFDGSTGYVSLPANSWFGLGSFSIEGWGNPTTSATGVYSPVSVDFQDSTDSNRVLIFDWPGVGGFQLTTFVAGTEYTYGNAGYTEVVNVWNYWAFTYNAVAGTSNFYWNGNLVTAGTDVASSIFAGITTAGADIGMLSNGQHGCVCYNVFDGDAFSGASIGADLVDSSGYAFGGNSNIFTKGKYWAPIGVYDDWGIRNEFVGVPDFEGNTSSTGAVLAVEVDALSAPSGYQAGDVVTGTGCSAEPTFTIPYVFSGGIPSNKSGNNNSVTVLTRGLGCTNATGVSTTGGHGTGLELNYHTSGYMVLLGSATKVDTPYEEGGQPDYLCGSYNEVSGALGSSSGAFYTPTYCPGASNANGGPHSDMTIGPGTAPYSFGIYNYLAWGGPGNFDVNEKFAFGGTSDGYLHNLYPAGPGFDGNSSLTYGVWGPSLWQVGVSNPVAGTTDSGMQISSQIANPGVPTLTAVGGTGTTSAPYGLVCNDGVGGTTLPATPVTTVSGPATLGTWLTLKIVSGTPEAVTGTATTSGATVTRVSGVSYRSSDVAWVGETVYINGQANTVSTVNSSSSLTLTAPAVGGPYGSAVAFSIINPYAQSDVGGHFGITGGDGTAEGTITQVNGGSGYGAVTAISSTPYVAGTQYNSTGSTLAGTGIFSTSGLTGTGLTVGGTSTYIAITLPHVLGCQSWTVLKTDISHKIPGANNMNGSTDTSSNLFDFGLAELSYSLSPPASMTRNTTGDKIFAGQTTLATVANFTSCGTSTSCAAPVALTPKKVVYSGVPFSSSTTLALTGMPAFTSITSYACFVTDTTHPAYTFGAANQSTTATTLTASTSNSDTVVVECDGY